MSIIYYWRGREAFLSLRSRRGTDCGALRRENVGLSNRIADESSAHRKSKVSLAMVFNQGLGGPKVNPKGVTDGQLVNIPTLLYFFDKVRSAVILADYWISRSWYEEQSEYTENSASAGNWDERAA